MKTLRGAAVALRAVLVTIVLLGATFAPGARADQWNKKTIVTFNDAVEIPGQVLPAGTYVFRLADSISNRHIVQIWNADEDQVLATIMTIPNTRFETPDDSLFQFDERAGRFAAGSQSMVLSGKQYGRGIYLFPLFVQAI